MRARVMNLVGRGSLNVWNKYFSNGAQAWDAMYGRGYSEKMESQDQRARHYLISGLIADRFPAAPKILDVGCGCGTMYQFVKRAGAEYFGLDLSNVAIQEGRAKFAGERRASFENIDFNAFKTSDRFDVVVLNEVLYYFPLCQVQATLRRANELLSEGGEIIISMSDNPKAKWVWHKVADLGEPGQTISMSTGALGSRWTIKTFSRFQPAKAVNWGVESRHTWNPTLVKV